MSKNDFSPCVDHMEKGDNWGYTKRRQNKIATRLHRIIYSQFNDIEISEMTGMVVRHTCDNPRCIRPDHLIIGTIQDNCDDMARRNRAGQTKLTWEQVSEVRKYCTPGTVGGSRNRKSDTSYNGFAKKFGVTSAAIRQAYLHKTFKFVPS